MDHSDLNNKMLKNLSLNTKLQILHLFNSCLDTSYIPLKWKQSTVSMLKKKSNDLNNIKSYRPISITSCLSKLNEKIIKTRIQNFLEKNNLIVKFQSGFRQLRKTKCDPKSPRDPKQKQK
jgi:hypothetical protein